MDILQGFATFGILVFWFVVILIPLVVVHELGHTLMAWLTKVRVVEFGVGLPPRTRFSFRWKKLLWSLNWLPLGGFAKIYGDHDALDSATSIYTSDKKLAQEQYQRERILEALDNDLETLLENNTLEYSDNWKKFEKLSGEYKVREVFNTTKVEDKKTIQVGSTLFYIASKKEMPESDFKLLESHLTQLNALTNWEFEGQRTTKKAFFNRGFFPKFLILIGGVLFNYLFAWILIFLLLNFGTIPRNFDAQTTPNTLPDSLVVTKEGLNNTMIVVKDSPLDKAGVPNRAKLVSLNGVKSENFKTFEEVRQQVQSKAGKPVSVQYIHPKTGEEKTIEVTPREQNGSYLVGIRLLSQQNYKAKDFWSSFSATTYETNTAVGTIWKGLTDVFTALLPQTQDRSALDNVGGPIAIAGAGSLTYEFLGITGILYIMALISLSLAVFNLLPLPVLDGGRILIALITRLTGSRNRKIEAYLINGTMILMLLLFVLIAIRDIGLVRNIF